MTRTKALLAMIVVLLAWQTVNTILIANAGSNLGSNQRKIAALARENQALVIKVNQRVTSVQAQRKVTVILVCHTVDQLVESLHALIIDSTKQSKIFNKLIRRVGGPSYKQRLAMARKQAKSLAPLDCKRLSASS